MATGRIGFVLGLTLTALVSGQAHAAFQKATLHKVSEKETQYRKNYRGKTGGLDIFKVRAVMNADNSTDLYFEVGLDPNYLPEAWQDLSQGAQIKKVQIKVFEENGAHVRTENINVGSAALVQHRTDLKRHQRIDASATVDNVPNAGSRTYVLSDSTTVLRRPDLAIVNIGADPNQTAGTSTLVTYTVKELNGDLPALGACQATFPIPQANAQFATTYPVGVWVEAGQSVDCVLNVSWSVAGTYNWKASVGTVVSDTLFYAERNFTNNGVTMPVTITGAPLDSTRQGFALARAYAYHFSSFGTYATSEYSSVAFNTVPPFFWQRGYTTMGSSGSVNDGITVVGQTAGRFIPYPMNVSYAEYGNDGVQILSSTGSSVGPLSTATFDWALYDEGTNTNTLVTETLDSDFLTDPATGAYFAIYGHLLVKSGTGEVVWKYTEVMAGRSYGNEQSFRLVKAAYNTDPNAPLDWVTLEDSSYFVEMGTPMAAPQSGSYRTTLNVTDGAGASYLADATVHLDVQSYSYESTGCYYVDYTPPDGSYHSVGSSCSEQYATSVSGFGGVTY